MPAPGKTGLISDKEGETYKSALRKFEKLLGCTSGFIYFLFLMV